jgi:hypothetical protein
MLLAISRPFNSIPAIFLIASLLIFHRSVPVSFAKSGKSWRYPKSSKSSKSFKGPISAERVITMWWIIFNKPSKCTGGTGVEGSPCTIYDALTGHEEAKVGVLHASGGVTDEDGFLRLVASVYKTQCDLNLDPPYPYGFCPAYDEEPEVSVVIRDHGPPTDDLILQMTKFEDPSCSASGDGGSNLCTDIGLAAFQQAHGTVVKDIGRFFPTSCIEDDLSGWPYCSEEEDAIQLQLDQGNQAVLMHNLDSDIYQVVAKFNVPRV